MTNGFLSPRRIFIKSLWYGKVNVTQNCAEDLSVTHCSTYSLLTYSGMKKEREKKVKSIFLSSLQIPPKKMHA